MGPPVGTAGLDVVAQMNTFTSFVSMLVDAGAKDENKLKAAQELSENLEVIVSSPQYPAFLDHAMKNFLKILQEGDPLFIAEYNIQQVRKLILEMIHRLPTNEHLRPYVKQTLNLMFRLLEKENEDNVLICLRIIIELHKQYRPQYGGEIQTFLQFVKCIYRDLPNHLNMIFEPRSPIKIKELSELNIEAVLSETFTSTVVLTETRTPDGNNISYNLIPKGVLSLKVLQELPIIVVLMYQLYKHGVHQDVAEFIPLIMATITLQPSAQHKSNPGFNKEIFVDFIGAQIKTLSFLAYIIRYYQEAVSQQAALMVKGILGLLTLCPMEVAHLRKELLIASRHILATDLRLQFIPHMERLFDENLLFGKGWTTNESLRPLAYSTLADLVHHVRGHLPMADLARAVHLFAKNVHDESLPTGIQTMSCKLLLNLVECIRQRTDVENGPGRDLLIEMLEVFVLKFKSIVKLQLPILMGKSNGTPSNENGAASSQAPSSPSSLSWSNSNGTQSSASPPTTDIKTEDSKSTLLLLDTSREEKEKMMKFAARTPGPVFSITECRSLVKTLVCGVKTITWGCAACKTPLDSTTTTANVSGKNLQPKETVIFIRLVQWAMKALDIYAINVPGVSELNLNNGTSSACATFPSTAATARQTSPPQTIRSKEEKEVLEHFAGVFAMMNPQTFKEVFATTIDYVVERIYRNSALQVVANSFLANPSTSAVFATILVEYLLNHMEEMGSNMERSNLYLKLFKLVFGSVSLFATENEQMLKPHLPHIVNKSMELALSAKEPYNYFLLLRALFRSIGGGSHDLLYQEFLPLLPNLLQSLNSLQSGLHKQHMKDLFVELCLTVPVRLSSLLPYLPMLMDPLVSSLNGSQTLVSQGLRTLELCVDNLQPDFLYEHIQPVRAELMQALWRTLRNPNDQIAHVAFRVLGKFGGGNRKMMVEPQRLDYWDKEAGPHILIHFQDLKQPVSLPVEKIMETSFSALKSSSTEPFYRRQCWEVVRCFLLSSLQLDDDRSTMQRLLTHSSFLEGDIHPVQSPSFQCSDKQARHVHQTAVTAMFVAAAIKELRQAVLPTMVSLVRHYTLVAVVQQAGPFPIVVPGRSAQRIQGMDPLVLVDALATIMGHEEKELCKPGHLALVLMLDTASIVLGSKERACKLPIIEYLSERMCSLCYDRAWYAKLGGCIAIKFLFERMAFKWVLEHQYVFLKALLFVMMDLTGEVSSGAVDMAKANLEKMLLLCAAPLTDQSPNEDLTAVQKKSLHDVTHELVRQVTSPNSTVREQAMHLLQVLARITNQTPTAIMEPHKEVLADMIPPKKHLLRHQPVNAQIGLMDGNTFCTTLEPRLFTIDLEVVEHKIFFSELLALCEADDASLMKLPCYKSVSNLTPLRKSVLQALAASHYIDQCRDKILNVIFKALSCNNAELQKTAFGCMKKILTGTRIEMETVHAAVRPLLLLLGDYRSLSTSVILRLSHTTQLFPHVFNEKLCEQLLTHLRKWLEVVIVAFKTGGNRPVATSATSGTSSTSLCSNEVKIAIGIIDLFHQIPAASARFLEILCKLVLQTERALGLEPGSPFREPLVKFLLRYPGETINLLFRDEIIADQDWNRFLEHFIRHPNGKPFRDAVLGNTNRLINFIIGGLPANGVVHKPHALQVMVRMLRILIRKDDQWISGQPQLIAALTKAWCSGRYEEKKTAGLSIAERKEQRQLAKILLHYFQQHPDEVELLFHLLRALCDRTIPDFYFLKEFLEKTVGQSYGADWKRAAFFKFVELFRDPNLNQELKAKILQHIIIPGFAVSFERGEGEILIGTPPTPDQDNNDSVVSVFINKVIDPDNPFGTSDAVRILLLQLSCLLVEQASQHIHDAANKRQGNKLRRLMTFAWPCLLSKNCVDPTTRYHGHLLLSHIIAKFAIHKRIVLQVFHSLLKAHAVEARNVVRQALEILTPAMPLRMEDGNTMLTHWTKKIIVEEGHTIAQLVHILQLLVRHYKVYYPVRHHLVQYMVTSIQRLGFTPTATLEHKKLAVDLAEVVLKWEVQRMRDEADSGGESSDEATSSSSLKRTMPDGLPEPKKPRLSTTSSSSKMTNEVNKSIEKTHCDAIANFLLRLACQVNDAAATANSSGEQLSKRCVSLLKMALKPDVWPNCELKLAWFDRLFQTVDNAATPAAPGAAAAANQPNFTNICTALELLTFLLNILRKEQVLAGFKPLQRGLASLMNCTNPKVIRCLHSLLSRLMTTFPTEPTNSTVASKHEELEGLYASVTKAIYEGLGAYEKNTTAASVTLLGTLMLLKSACTNNPCYIDRLITTFMRALQRMTREHLVPVPGQAPGSTEAGFSNFELLILSLDLVKNRVGVMGVEMRKAFIGSILVGLLEKSTESKVVRAIVRMLDEWMKTKTPIAINQGPSLREKSILLVKMMQCLEKRFPDDVELNISFLELINFVYCEETLKGTELVAKLEPAFLAGLRCPQPATRAKFFEVLDNSMRRRLHDRLLYIVCSQNWEAILAHYWIKQCLELILVTSVPGNPIHTAPTTALLPSVTSVIASADATERETFTVGTSIKEEPDELLDVFAQVKEDDIDMDLSNVPTDPMTASGTNKTGLATLVNRQIKFLETGREVTSSQFLEAVAQLAHMDTSLAETLWLDLFPRIWKVLGDRQQQALSVELVPFLCSGAHVIQKDCQPSAINTFSEALSLCVPPIRIKPCLLKYLGKSHNLWHRTSLMLEQLAFDGSSSTSHNKIKQKEPEGGDPDSGAVTHQETLDALSEMYSTLKEEDLWSGLWQRRAHLPETVIAVAYEQQGFFEQAQGTYELAMTKARQEFNMAPAPVSLQSEYRLLEEHWIRCGKELNQWELLQEFGNSPGCLNSQLVLESAWRTPNWPVVRDALTQLEQSCPKEYAWKVNLYRGFLAMCHPEEQHPNMVERYVELASSLCIREWRRLPSIVSHVHLSTLQAAQQVVELQEAAQIHQGLLQARPGTLHDVKAIVKTWRNRLPVIADDLSHWSDVFTWRQHHYQFIVSHYDQQGDQQASAQSMLGVHASAQAIIHFGKVARKHNLTGVCLDSLARIYSIPSVPIVDCFQKIRQQVKCYLQAANVLGKNELQEGLEVIESTNLKYFAKEMTAELYALKGMLLAQIGRADDANKAFSAAVQMHDTLVKAWALWGDHLEQVFTKDSRNISTGVSAITCFLHACRHQNESKSRKYLAKVLWLLTYDNEKELLAEAMEKYCVGVPPVQWLPWIPQLLVCLVGERGKYVLNLLSQVGRMFPQAVYFPIRTLYLTLKIEQREWYKTVQLATERKAASAAANGTTPSATAAAAASGTAATGTAATGTAATGTAATKTPASGTGTASGTTGTAATAEKAPPIRATPSMWLCSRIMHMQRDLHPTVLSSLEGIVDQMVWFRENWYEEVLRQLRQGLAKCYAIAFENRGSVSDATITQHTLSFVKKLVATFGIGIENIANSANGSFSSAASESLARRAQATAQDPVFQRMKTQFSTDFDFTQPGAMKLHNLIHKLKKWIKILEAKTKLLPRSFLIEEKCRFLSNFNLQTAEVELPGEFLLPKHTHYYVRIARFLPRVEIVQKHNTAARRLYIRGHNGKIYPYLVVNDAGLGDARREERVLQLLRMLNHYLNKHKETSKRFLNFTVPRVVAVSPQMRLVEDNPSSITLLDVYRQRCIKRNVEHDMPIAKYYERLATIQARGNQASHQVLRDIHKDVQQIMVPRTMLREWANITFPSATAYWTFRKMLTLQMALVNLAEFVLHLTRLNADMLYIHQDSGLLSVSYFKFDLDDNTGELDAKRPVPFRLTPNMAEFLTMIGVAGPLTASMIAAARCLVQPSAKVAAILKAVLRDEFIAWHKKKSTNERDKEAAGNNPVEGEILIGMVNKAVAAIINRLQGLSTFDGNDSKVSTLVAAANSNDNLCRMDPAWHPWL